MKKKMDPAIVEQIEKLEKKYEVMGQDLSSYLDGLLYSNYLTYWDYIHLDTLLSLQNPKTDFPDEMIFVMYHQTTELFFKLVLCEMKQLSEKAETVSADEFCMRLERINRYFHFLAESFSIMTDGMEKEQFLKYRMSLLPASGFQSAQYRMIEIHATDLRNLVDKDKRDELKNSSSVEKMFEHIYWKQGAVELATGKKTLTLRQFEAKYEQTLIKLCYDMREVNLWQIYQKNFAKSEKKEKIKTLMRAFDVLVNVNWPLAHYRTAVRYLNRDPETISATGGTNWQKYLPPRFQKRIFYPKLWTEKEKEEWGKQWVEEHALGIKTRF